MAAPVPPITLQASAGWRRYSWLVHFIGLLMVVLLPWYYGLPLMPMIIWSAWREDRRLQTGLTGLQLRVTVAHEWQYRLPGEEHWQTGQLLAGSRLLPVCMALKLRLADQSIAHWWLAPDMMTEDDWRRLTVWLRWRGGFMQASPSSGKRVKA